MLLSGSSTVNKNRIENFALGIQKFNKKTQLELDFFYDHSLKIFVFVALKKKAIH